MKKKKKIKQRILTTFYKYWAKRFTPKCSKFFKLIDQVFLNKTHCNRKSSLSINELKEAFFSLKTDKSLGYDKINLHVVKKYFGEINESLKHLFNISLENEIFPEKVKIAKVTPIFKTSNP